MTLVPDPSSPGHYVALLPESTRALNLTLPEWVDVECRGEGCEVVEDGGGGRRLLETSPVQVRLGCGPTALDATDGSTSITITLQGLEDCERSTPAGAIEEPGQARILSASHHILAAVFTQCFDEDLEDVGFVVPSEKSLSCDRCGARGLP